MQRKTPAIIRFTMTLAMIIVTWNICFSQSLLKYYGVDDITKGEFPFLKDSLGGNFGLVELYPDSTTWKNTLAEAEKNDIKIVIYPLGSGHQWTPWAWKDSVWDISEGLAVMEFAENYIASGGEALLAVVMSHEPFYNNGDPFTTKEMQLLYSDLKSVAPSVQLYVYMNDMAYYDKRPDTPIEDGIMDIAGIWLHCFGGAEGTWEFALREIDNVYALVQEKKLSIQLFFAIQTFAIEGTRYKMPSAADMKDFGTQVFEKNKLDGIFWYPWNRVSSSYTSYLHKDRYDDLGEDRWKVVSELSPFLPGTGIRDGNNASTFSISQNYPNPFSTTTTIEFKVEASGWYSIHVFNLMGQQVATLFDKYVSPGTYTVDYHANQLSPGAYLYNLKDKNSIITRMMIIK